MKKFPKLKYPSDSATDGLLKDSVVVVTEKLDGANFRFSWDDGLVVGTRNHTYAADDENLPKAFEHAVEYVQRRLDEAEQSWLHGFKSGKWTLFGEAMHLHSLDYDDIDWHTPSKGSRHVPLDSDHPNVVIFDVWHEDDGWLPWDDVRNVVTNSPFESTPVIEKGDPDDLSFEIPDDSMCGGNSEGIVARRVDGEVRAKKVSEDFKEVDSSQSMDPTKAESDAAEFVNMFVTPARVEKMANKLVDEGEYDSLEMSIMEQLPARVIRDVMDEEGWNLMCNEYDFECQFDENFKSQVRSRTSRQCARVLKQELQSF